MSEHETEAVGPAAIRRRKRLRWTIGAAVALTVVGIGTSVVLSNAFADAPPPPSAGPETATVQITKQDLAESESVTGDLGHGPQSPLSGRKEGTLTRLPAVGDVVERGGPLYEVDAEPVPLFYGDLPLYRPLESGVDDGADVELVEKNLVELGFGGFGEPDEHFTWATARALRQWQESLGLPETGEIAPGDVVVRSGPVRIADVTAQLGGPAAGELMRLTGTGRLVTAELDLDRQNIAKPGAEVTVELPDGGTSKGKVTKATPKAPEGEGDGAPGDQEAKLEVVIELTDDKAAGDLASVPVTVTFTSGTRQGVLTVPIGALLALREGGHAVEVVEGGGTRLVKVEPGLFAEGQVEISGEGLAEGMTVVTTS